MALVELEPSLSDIKLNDGTRQKPMSQHMPQVVCVTSSLEKLSVVNNGKCGLACSVPRYPSAMSPPLVWMTSTRAASESSSRTCVGIHRKNGPAGSKPEFGSFRLIDSLVTLQQSNYKFVGLYHFY